MMIEEKGKSVENTETTIDLTPGVPLGQGYRGVISVGLSRELLETLGECVDSRTRSRRLELGAWLVNWVETGDERVLATVVKALKSSAAYRQALGHTVTTIIKRLYRLVATLDFDDVDDLDG